ncbi:hypothetical protein [Cellulosimicrobium arenosum]|uniref:Uncharacterized protein n=1 Tax=Cellulosimicrobium arenosum TaxID=2708133 RepID=A0A927PFK5_9MICO|nr:hypothetical protein [Cellulosimicrobium arenosum]MBD8079805.1 hypothetical protein [Cellulosimicrobium arenosum]
MNRRPARPFAAAGVALLLVVGASAVGGPAVADEPDLAVVTWDHDPLRGVSEPSAPVGTGRSCATQLPEIDRAAASPSQRVCFDSLAEALSYVSGDAVPESRLAGADRADLARLVADLNAEPARSAASAGGAAREGATTAAASSMLLGVTWRSTKYRGESEIFWGSGPNGCFRGSTYGFSNLARYLQNNVVSSADSFAGCWGTYYDKYSYAGTKLNCKPSCSTMGGMDNRASSIVYRPKGTLG